MMQDNYEFTKTNMREAIQEIIEINDLDESNITIRVANTFDVAWSDFKPIADIFQLCRPVSPDGKSTWNEYVKTALNSAYGLSKYDYNYDLELFVGKAGATSYYADIVFNEKHGVWEWEGNNIKHE